MFQLVELAKVIRILGVDYLKLLACWGFVSLAVVSRWLPLSALPSVFTWAVVLLQLMLLFVAAGVLLFHHRDALGVPVEREEKSIRVQRRADSVRDAERRTELNRAYVFFSRDNNVGGLACVRDYLKTHDDEDSWRWFLDQMSTWESKAPMLLLARNYFSRLVASDDGDAAAELLLACINFDRQFAPHPDDRAYARALLAGHRFEPLAAQWR